MSTSKISAISQIKDLVNSGFEGLICCDDSNLVYGIWEELFLPTELRKNWNLAIEIVDMKGSIYLVKNTFNNHNSWMLKYREPSV